VVKVVQRWLLTLAGDRVTTKICEFYK